MAVQETDGKQTAMRIDMNSDMGESFGRWTLGDDEALLDVVSSANVACSFHAGDPSVMLRTLSYAASRGVMVGAHVAYRDLAAQAGLRVFHEAFADRAYNADGTLVSRRLPDAVIADPAEVAARVLRMVCEHEVVASDGTVVPLNADSVCVHGDSPSAVAMARAVRARLESEGVAIRAFAGDAAASAARD